ncbi:MaoC family dehydratase [Tomitella fengzijianii]|uniref:MaoC family dehydratase n=1 Tax=Tomitella fengzijianii TaxID=2597660 RepID=A0A516WZA4_9ACTN|nr:MaoC family dehydratase [Tomitella fengzijianii]QDQ96163.1 MaoC family dehydratase [Tomitella fengzijianii]
MNSHFTAQADPQSQPRRVRLADLPSLVGESLGPSRRILIDQERINGFADATGDHQWIHVDPERAKDGPFGTTIAHGYLTLSLAVDLFWDVLDVTGSDQVINYGLEKVRFPAPVPVGSEVGATATIDSVDAIAGGYQVGVTLVFDVPGIERPVCVCATILRYLGDVES